MLIFHLRKLFFIWFTSNTSHNLRHKALRRQTIQEQCDVAAALPQSLIKQDFRRSDIVRSSANLFESVWDYVRLSLKWIECIFYGTEHVRLVIRTIDIELTNILDIEFDDSRTCQNVYKHI